MQRISATAMHEKAGEEEEKDLEKRSDGSQASNCTTKPLLAIKIHTQASHTCTHTRQMARPSFLRPSNKAGVYRRRKKHKNCCGGGAAGPAPSHPAESAAPSLERSPRGCSPRQFFARRPHTSPPLLLELRGTVLGSSRVVEGRRQEGALVSTTAWPLPRLFPLGRQAGGRRRVAGGSRCRRH